MGPCCRKTTRHCTQARIRAYMSVWCFQSDLAGLYPISKQMAKAGRKNPNSHSSPAQRATNGGVKLADMRDVRLAPGRSAFAAPQNANDFRGRYARGHAIDLGEAHHAIASDHEHRRLGDAALLPRIINVHSFTRRRWVSHKTGNGRRSSRRSAWDLSGGSTETAATSAPAARISS